MKNSLAILFISIFAFSQYAKQLSYLECKLANNFKKTTGQQCDCEKQTDVSNTDKDLPPSKNHTQFNLDEFYTVAEELDIKLQHQYLSSRTFTHFIVGETEAHCCIPYRPPRCN
ncbi:MAG: hypothetical protein ABJA78_05480 [Ferruginibacter sp.]